MINILLAVLVALQAPVREARDGGLAADVKTLASAATNEARFDALTALLRARTLSFAVESFTIEMRIGSEPRTNGRNIVLTIGEGPSDVVIGAHYDAARLPDGTLSKGAVDNAASSVLLVRLADMLRAETFPFRLKIVWFDMEELGLIGSAKFVQQHGADRIAAMVNFDINAYGDTILFGPWRADNVALRRAVVETCALEDIPCMNFTQMPPGDDRSFLKAGIPTVSLALLPALEAHQLWLTLAGGPNSGLAQGTMPAIFRNIHSAEDVPEKLNEENMSLVLRYARSLARALGRAVGPAVSR
ncbi:MAG: M28 family metallopeptidase [Vicinamibacterales bacterium]